MSASAMLTVKKILNIQPGEIPPVIHIKQGSDSIDIILRIRAGEAALTTGGQTVLKGHMTDGTTIFAVIPVSGSDGAYFDVDIYYDIIKKLTEKAGRYYCTLSLIDSENSISEADYEDYDCVTVQPFTLDIEKSAVE